jgi:hypothetical protein
MCHLVFLLFFILTLSYTFMTNFQGYEYCLNKKTHFLGKIKPSQVLVKVISSGASAGRKIRF